MRRERDGIGQSLDVYYRDAARTQRMDRLNSQFVSRGALAFDIGAHVGDRTASFLRLGASVVAVEPQPKVFRALKLIHGRNPHATLVRQAVGAKPGEVELYINSRNPTVSTASSDLVRAAQASANWTGQEWDRHVKVPITTLEQLIKRYGQPNFVKIDVEGYEAEVLAGLSTPISSLSFEFTTIQRDIAYDCLGHLENLGCFEFNLSLGEDHALRHDNWISGRDINHEIQNLPESANSGDIYARRRA